MNTKYDCLRCGECCKLRGLVRVSGLEIDRIAGFLSMDPRAFIEKFTRLSRSREGLEIEEKENGECVFLDGAQCAIHTVKPRQCRTFPKEWRYPEVKEVCPAYRQGQQ